MRVAIARDGRGWAIAPDGDVLKLDGKGVWQPTKGEWMQDIAVGYDNDVWLAGRNGTVWTTRDGQAYNQINASGFSSISVGADAIWAAGDNGTLWSLPRQPDPPKVPIHPVPAEPPVVPLDP